MIEFFRDGDIWSATINRPDKANSLTHEMLVSLASFMEDAQAARAVILTGKGKVFSAGADLDEARAGLATSDIWERLSGAIAALPGLSICAHERYAGRGRNGNGPCQRPSYRGAFRQILLSGDEAGISAPAQ